LKGIFPVADYVPELSFLGGEQKGTIRLVARVAHHTDVGRRRRNNQDNHLVLPLGGGEPQQGSGQGIFDIDRAGLLLAVADGMGGHYGGEVASRLCLESLGREIVTQVQKAGYSHPNLPAVLQSTVETAHRELFAHAQTYEEKLTMGTTLTAVLIQGLHADIAQVGDSRAYLFRDGNLILLTQDQTIGNQLRTRGEDSTTVDAHIQEMLVQAVGAQANIEVTMVELDLEPGDQILVCCDGLYKVVPPDNIVDVLEFETGIFEKVTLLVDRANEAGGPDNITGILAEVCQS
jgi:PPM family protein phosphatase